MAMLRTIGSYIENSGIDMCWIESELHGPSTVKQILDGKHVRRGEKAHMKTLQSLFSLYQEAFFKQEAELYHNLQRLAQELGDACKDGAKALVEKAHEDMVNAIISFSVLEKMSIVDAAHGNDPMFPSKQRTWQTCLPRFEFIIITLLQLSYHVKRKG